MMPCEGLELLTPHAPRMSALQPGKPSVTMVPVPGVTVVTFRAHELQVRHRLGDTVHGYFVLILWLYQL